MKKIYCFRSVALILGTYMYEMRRLNRALDLWPIEVGCFYQKQK